MAQPMSFLDDLACVYEGSFLGASGGILARDKDAYGDTVVERQLKQGDLVALCGHTEYGILIQHGFHKEEYLALVAYIFTMPDLRDYLAEGKVINADELKRQIAGMSDDIAFVAPSSTQYLDIGEICAGITQNELKSIMRIHPDLYLDVREGDGTDITNDQRPHIYTLRSREDLKIEYGIDD